MSDLMAYCGIDCGECSAYKATAANDDALREQTAAEWRKMFSPNIKAEDINCLGCKSDIRFSHCNVCNIRTCSSGKSLNHCAECDAFGCDDLKGFWQMAPGLKEKLEKLRK